MFGLGGSFPYLECSVCGCVQLVEPPADLGAYYPSGLYYSLDVVKSPRPRPRAVTLLVQARNRYEGTGRGIMGYCLSSLSPRRDLRPARPLVDLLAPFGRNARILDVGCGSGRFLSELSDMGFAHLRGVDPYLSKDIIRPATVIWARELADVPESEFDVVMLHHSLEHIPDQHGTMFQVRRLLTGSGQCVIRIPIASTGPWKRYGTSWFELDAPRHFFLHTRDSFARLANDCGFHVRTWQPDRSNDHVIYAASERYRSGKPLHENGQSAPHAFTAPELNAVTSLVQDDSDPERAGRVAVVLVPK
jgi:SAM-dependent methyltransferase